MAYKVRNPHFRAGAIETGTVAWILHRASGVFLTIYLITHIIVIGQSVRGQEAFDDALAFVQTPVFVFLDAGLAAVVAFHGLNGLRIVAFDLGVGIHQQKPLFWASLIISVIVFVAGVYVARNLIF